jgi:hypothetical protein
LDDAVLNEREEDCCASEELRNRALLSSTLMGRWLQWSPTAKRTGSVVGGNQGPFDMNALSNLSGQPTKLLGESALELDFQLDYVGSTGVVFAEADELIETVPASPREVKLIGTD